MVLTHILLTGVSISSLVGYYYLLRQRKLTKLFENLDKIPFYDFDYVPQTTDLPLNKTMAFFAEIDMDKTQFKQSKFNPRKKVVFSSVQKILPREKKVTKQSLSDENEYFDEFYHTIQNQGLPKIYLRNVQQEIVEVHWPDVSEIGLFYVKPIIDKIDLTKIAQIPQESPLEKLQAMLPGQKKLEYGEIGIQPQEKYIYVGELHKAVNRADRNAEPKLIFRPKFILGESKEFFVKYIDSQLVKSLKNMRTAFAITGALAATHFGIQMYRRYNPEPAPVPVKRRQPQPQPQPQLQPQQQVVAKPKGPETQSAN